MQSSSASARYLPNVAQQESKHSWAFHSSVVNNSPLCANAENESNVCKSERRPVRKCYTAKRFAGPRGLATLACSDTKPTSPTLNMPQNHSVHKCLRIWIKSFTLSLPIILEPFFHLKCTWSSVFNLYLEEPKSSVYPRSLTELYISPSLPF